MLQIVVLTRSINKVKDQMFREFSKKVGVKNVREYEERIEQQLLQREERLSKLNRHIVTIEANIEMAERQADELDVMLTADEEDLQVELVCHVIYIQSG